MNKENLLKKYKNLPQYKNLSDEEILNLIEKKQNEEAIINNLSFCIDDEEKRFAQDLLDRYLGQSSFENEADKDTLRQLIDLELLAERFKKQLKTEYVKANPSIPLQMVEQLRETERQILELKEKLGLTSSDKNQTTGIQELERLKKKALKYFEEHKGCNVVKCPYCQKLFYLLMRIENLTPEKATIFKGTVLYNKTLFKMYEDKRITAEELADILGVSIFYITYIFDNLYLKEKDK